MSDSGSDNIGAPIVIDNGSDTIKAGLGGEDVPYRVFPTVVGRSRTCNGGLVGSAPQGPFVGDEAVAKRTTSILRHPIEHGVVTNWDDMERVWHHTFHHQLKTDPEDSCVMLTEAVLTPKANRETMTQIMFETFNAGKFSVQNQPTLGLYATARSTGLVVDSGHEVTQVVPVYEGYALPHAIPRSTLCSAGNELTSYLETLLVETGGQLPVSANERGEIARDIKEKMCYVALDADAEQLAHRQSEEAVASLAQVPSSVMPMDLVNHCVNFMGAPKNYQLPDGTKISVGPACFRCPEAIFNPRMGRVENEGPGLHELVADSIQKCDDEIRGDLYANIVLSGGSTMFRGFAARLTRELETLADLNLDRNVEPCKQGVQVGNQQVKVIDSPEREYGAWIGASILSNLSSFNHMWITKDEYDENGPVVVHRKCF